MLSSRVFLRHLTSFRGSGVRRWQVLFGSAAAAGVLMIVGCSASQVDPTVPGQSAYAPANEEPVDGEVAYLDAGARSVRNARREDAYKKMHAFCGGDYVIVREELAESANLLAVGARQRRIFFRCLEPEAAAGGPEENLSR